MHSKTPTIRQTAWVSLIPQILFMGLLIYLFHQFTQKEAGLYGALTYLSLSFILRNYVPKNHRKGISLFNNNKYLEGIEYFKKSYIFFKQNEFLDKYRYLLLLNSSKMGYKEMALNNIAFGYGQIGEGKESKEYYQRTLFEFPNNIIAQAALKMIAAAEENKNEILNTETTITQINKGLKIGKENKLIDWGKSFNELKDDAETFHVDENGIHHIYFGKKEIFPNIILGLYTPFDTCQENFKDTTLNHLGQNLNVSDVEILTEKLIVHFGNPIEKDNEYGCFYRKWKINDVIIEIIPRSHHGSDWNAIIIKKQNLPLTAV